MRVYVRPGVDPENFGGGCNFELDLMLYKNDKRLDAEKIANKPFENFSCLRRNQKFF